MLLAKLSVAFPPGSNHVEILHNALGWRIEDYFLVPKYMIYLLDQLSVIKMEFNSKRRDGSRGVKK